MTDFDNKNLNEEPINKEHDDENTSTQEEHVKEESNQALEKIQAELLLYKDKYLRLAADFENYKKISQREQGVAVRFATESLVIALLPIYDNLQSAVATNSEKNNLSIGVEMVLKQLEDTLQKFGVKFFSAMGQSFDPNIHEAISQQENDDVDEGSILFEYQKGCYLHERLIRPSRVVVSKKSNKSEK